VAGLKKNVESVFKVKNVPSAEFKALIAAGKIFFLILSVVFYDSAGVCVT